MDRPLILSTHTEPLPKYHQEFNYLTCSVERRGGGRCYDPLTANFTEIDFIYSINGV